MNEDRLSLAEISELDPAELGQDTLGFIVDSYFNDTPFLKGEDFETESLNKVNNNALQWKGTFKEAFGIEQVKMSLWIMDKPKLEDHDRYFIARFSDAEGNTLNILPVLKELLGLGADNNLSIPSFSPNESEQVSPHHFRFDDSINSYIWFSSHKLAASQFSSFFPELAITDFPDELEIGFQWQNNIDFKIGHEFANWFKIDFFEELKITSIYRRRVRADELELRISIPENQAHVNQQQVGGSELDKDKSGISLKINYVSVFFSHTEDQLSFNGFGLKGDFNIVYLGKKLDAIDFGGRINTKTGILNLWADNFPTIKELESVFIPENEQKAKFEIPNFGLDQLRVKHLELQLNVLNFDIQFANLVLDAHPPIKLNDYLTFYPKLTASIKDPLNSREVNWQLEGWVKAFDAFFSASYSSKNELFHLSLNNGKLSSESIMTAMQFPSMQFPDINIIDLEFTATHSNGNWNYAGGIVLSGKWEWQLPLTNLKIELVGLHADFQYNNALTHFLLGGQFLFGKLVLDASVVYESEDGFYLQAIISDIKISLDKFPTFIGLESHLKDDNQEIIERVQSSLDLPAITIDQLMVECFLPEDETESKAVSFVTAISIDRDVLPIPIDSLFLQLDWSETLKWSAMVHFTFQHTFEDGTKGLTELFLRSEKTDKELSFSGSMLSLHIDDLVQFFAERFGLDYTLPAFLKGITLEKIEVSLTETDTDWKFTFECDTKIVTEQATVHQEEKSIATQLIFTIEKYFNEESQKKEYKIDLAGHLFIPINEKETLNFGLHFHHEADRDWLLASYKGEVDIPVSQLLESWLHSETKWPELSLKISSACIFIQSRESAATGNAEEKKRERSIFFGVEMATAIQLKEMPFLETILTDDLTAGIEQFRVAYTSSDIDKVELNSLSTEFKESLDEAGITNLPVPQSEKGEIGALGKGFHVSGKLKLAQENEYVFSVGPEASEKESSAQESSETKEDKNAQLLAAASTAAPKESSLIGKWFKVGKTLGPLTIGRIGIQYDYQEQHVWILLDAGLEIAILNVSVDGLGIGSPLSDFQPKLRMSGLGVDFHKDSLEIGGALILQEPTEEYPDATTFSGMLTLQFKALGLSVFGSYTDALGDPSFLIYGVLDYPIGGPPFFLVKGLAAGVGINRKVHYPSIDELGKFSLIDAVMNADIEITLTDRISRMEKDLKPELGSYFFAAGVEFSTFKLLNSFVLLILGMGEHTELDLLGYSILSAPLPLEEEDDTKVDPVAQARLLVHAAFRPDAGTLQVEARLDAENSFLVSRSCKLQGGFAFYAWFKEGDVKNGDFVLTLGGYHAHFNVPPHYPQVPRLGFHWQVDPHILFKGELYFALTPNALMTGGLLEGNWKKDHFEASFRLALNLLMQWQPFHYEGDFSLSIKVAYRNGIFQEEAELTTEISIWGPEFGGTAHIKILIIELDVDFGTPKAEKSRKLDWEGFATAFLSPVSAKKEVPDAFSCRVSKGLMAGATEENSLGTVDPSALELYIESIVPITDVIINGVNGKETMGPKTNKAIGIAPMNLQNINSTLHLKIKYEEDKIKDFDFEPILKNAPAALWGKEMKPKLNSVSTVDNCLFGYRIVVKPELFHKDNSSIEVRSTNLEAILINPNVNSTSVPLDPLDWDPVNAEVWQNTQINKANSRVLSAFGIQPKLKKERRVFQPLQLLRPFKIPNL